MSLSIDAHDQMIVVKRSKQVSNAHKRNENSFSSVKMKNIFNSTLNDKSSIFPSIFDFQSSFLGTVFWSRLFFRLNMRILSPSWIRSVSESEIIAFDEALSIWTGISLQGESIFDKSNKHNDELGSTTMDSIIVLMSD